MMKIKVLSLKIKIFIAISSILTVFVGLQFIFEYTQLKKNTLEYLKTSNNTINTILAANIRGYIFNRDIDNIRYQVDIIRNKYIGNIYILDSDGRILYSQNKTSKKAIDISKIKTDFILHSTFELLDVNMGHMIIEANIEQYNKEIKESVDSLVYRNFFVYCIGLFISWLIARQMSNPINSMIEYLRKSNANEKIVFQNLHIDEFNFLAQVIEKERNSLIELNHNLENKVKEEVNKNREVEKRLFEAEKLASMGEMIGNIAHQWRQPLNALALQVQDIGDAYEFEEINKEYVDTFIDKSMTNINFMSKTIDDFRNFFKPNKIQMRFNLLSIIEEVLSITSATLRNNNIELKIETNNQEHFILGYQNEFKQVILNLINNAKDALTLLKKDNKLIWIELKSDERFEYLIIRDNAGGIPESIIDRVFEPYFTTKEEGKGTGIGLYMSKMIIEDNMQGKLSVYNDENGAVFTIQIEKNI